MCVEVLFVVIIFILDDTVIFELKIIYKVVNIVIFINFRKFTVFCGVFGVFLLNEVFCCLFSLVLGFKLIFDFGLLVGIQCMVVRRILIRIGVITMRFERLVIVGVIGGGIHGLFFVGNIDQFRSEFVVVFLGALQIAFRVLCIGIITCVIYLTCVISCSDQIGRIHVDNGLWKSLDLVSHVMHLLGLQFDPFRSLLQNLVHYKGGNNLAEYHCNVEGMAIAVDEEVAVRNWPSYCNQYQLDCDAKLQLDVRWNKQVEHERLNDDLFSHFDLKMRLIWEEQFIQDVIQNDNL